MIDLDGYLCLGGSTLEDRVSILLETLQNILLMI